MSGTRALERSSRRRVVFPAPFAPVRWIRLSRPTWSRRGPSTSRPPQRRLHLQGLQLNQGTLGGAAHHLHLPPEPRLGPGHLRLRGDGARVAVVPVLHPPARGALRRGGLLRAPGVGEPPALALHVFAGLVPGVLAGLALGLPLVSGGLVRARPQPRAAVVEPQRVPGERLQQRAVVGHHHPDAPEAPEGRDEPAPAFRVEVVGGLVEEQHVGLACQRRGDLPALALAGGERGPARHGARVQPELPAQASRQGLFGLCERQDVRPGLLDFLRAQPEQVRFGFDAELAAGGLELTGEQPQQRGLAGSVGSYQAGPAGAEVEVDLVEEGDGVGEREGDAVRAQGRQGGLLKRGRVGARRVQTTGLSIQESRIKGARASWVEWSNGKQLPVQAQGESGSPWVSEATESRAARGGQHRLVHVRQTLDDTTALQTPVAGDDAPGNEGASHARLERFPGVLQRPARQKLGRRHVAVKDEDLLPSGPLQSSGPHQGTGDTPLLEATHHVGNGDLGGAIFPSWFRHALRTARPGRIYSLSWYLWV